MGERPTLSAAVFDRAADRRTDGGWLAEAWQRARVVAVSHRSATPIADGRVSLQDPQRFDGSAARFLGLVGDQPYFAVDAEPEDGQTWLTLREIGPDLPALDAGLLVTAIALAQWHARHPRCPLCGAETRPEQAGWTRRCPQDDSQHFPRTDPAVIMLVHDGRGHALFGRSPGWPAGRFSTLAGFVEPGESLESAVAREVFEETGVQVSGVTYVGSQPWPFPSSLMLGFAARAERGEVRVDEVEMAEARWFDRDEIARAADWTDRGETGQLQLPGRFSISRFLIDQWLAGEFD